MVYVHVSGVVGKTARAEFPTEGSTMERHLVMSTRKHVEIRLKTAKMQQRFEVGHVQIKQDPC
jgi:hypothetical protein